MMTEVGKEQIRVSTQELHPGICEVRIEGSLDWSNFTRVEAVVNEIFQKGTYRLVVDLRGTTYISSAGFGCFISSLDVAMKNGGDIIFAAVPPDVFAVFTILGLDKILRFAEDEAAAVKQFTA